MRKGRGCRVGEVQAGSRPTSPCPTITFLSYSNCQGSTHSISKWLFRHLALLVKIINVNSKEILSCILSQFTFSLGTYEVVHEAAVSVTPFANVVWNTRIIIEHIPHLLPALAV